LEAALFFLEETRSCGVPSGLNQILASKSEPSGNIIAQIQGLGVKLIADLIFEGGIANMRRSVSNDR
jgi:ketol-acid reductoisomerase